jgi:hypothetical protein|tara:strand:+ start:293 stop:511 length:219 start_codon:yes stop_codon:yes gene_type:complete
MYKYKPNDVIELKDGNKCKIVRIADWNEYGCDFHFFEKNYVIDFIDEKKKRWASYQIYRNDRYYYVMTENEF